MSLYMMRWYIFYLTIELISIAFISYYVIIKSRIMDIVKNKPPRLNCFGGLFYLVESILPILVIAALTSCCISSVTWV